MTISAVIRSEIDQPHQPTGERIDHGGAVDPAVFRAVLRDVAEPEPEPVRLRRPELPSHEILMRRGVGLPAASFSPV